MPQTVFVDQVFGGLLALGAVRGFDVENRFYGDLNLNSWLIDQ
jgi:hypothetical protein